METCIQHIYFITFGVIAYFLLMYSALTLLGPNVIGPQQIHAHDSCQTGQFGLYL